jgi:hypothetical protein
VKDGCSLPGVGLNGELPLLSWTNEAAGIDPNVLPTTPNEINQMIDISNSIA